MRPAAPTAVHKTDRLAELVCSNSFRGDKLDNAVGLLKEEMRRLDSLVMRAAEAQPRAGGRRARRRSRAVRRDRSRAALTGHPLITIVARRGDGDSAVDRARSGDHRNRSADVGGAVAPIIARSSAASISYFYDAISPIVLAETIDRSKVFRAVAVGTEVRGRYRVPESRQSSGCHDASAAVRRRRRRRATT